MKKLIPPDFIIIPRSLLENENLTPLDEKVFGFIYWLTKLKNEKCTASNQTIADLCKCNPESITNSLIKLENAKCILRVFKDLSRRKRQEIKCLIGLSHYPMGHVPLDNGIGVPLDNGHNNKSIYNNSNKSIYHRKNQNFSGNQGNQINSLISAFKEVNPTYEQFFSNKTQRGALERLVKKFSYDKVKAMIQKLSTIIYQPYAPKVTTPLELERDLSKLTAFTKQQRSDKGAKFVDLSHLNGKN